MKPAREQQRKMVKDARAYLAFARDLLKQAGCSEAVEKTRRAIKSAEGAQRHVQHRILRTDIGEV